MAKAMVMSRVVVVVMVVVGLPRFPDLKNRLILYAEQTVRLKTQDMSTGWW